MSRHNQCHLVEAHVSLTNCCVPHALPVCLRHGFTLTRPCFIVIRLEPKTCGLGHSSGGRLWSDLIQPVFYWAIIFSGDCIFKVVCYEILEFRLIFLNF